MAIALDTSATWANPNSSGANTVSYTCTGTNLVLLVSIATGSITAATYAGVAMTKLIDSPTTGISYYYLQAPATGANNVVITRSGSSIATYAGVIISFTGVVQTGNPFGTRQGNTGTSTTGFSNNYTTTTTASYILDMFSTAGTPGAAPSPVTATGTGHINAQSNYTGGGDQTGAGLGYTPTTTATAYSIGYSWTVIVLAATWNVDYYELLPFVAATNGFNIALV